MDNPLSQPVPVASDRSGPQLQEAIQLTHDATMNEGLDMVASLTQDLDDAESSEEDSEEDSITDETSDDEDRVIPKGLPVSRLPTGLCYDDRMRYHSEVAAPTGDSVHPEDPRRIYYIYKELCEAGLVAGEERYQPLIDPPLKRIEAREATREEICLVHEATHYDFVESTADLANDQLIDLSEDASMDSIYFNALSFFSGKLSAGGAIETCRAVVAREVKNAIAVIRPPGHHAEVDRTMGFCLFNNTCIASRVCQKEFGETCRKILILDWDVHHGNGCQKAFYDDPNILYISIHVHMNGQFYPSGPDGNMYHVGEGHGIGKNINIPWETKGMGDGDYMYAFQHVVMPIASEFDPDLVIISAGFDAAAGDELGGCFVTPPCYAHMTHMLMSLANGKVAVCLEGGYNFQAISKSALAVTRTLMGEPPDRLMATQPSMKGIAVVQKVREIQSRYWNSVYPKDLTYGIRDGDMLNDIIREWQAMHLYDKYRLTDLRILRPSVSKSFEKQVLATPDYDTKSNLLLFIHDPPDLMSKRNVLDNKLDPHQTWMSDATQSYIGEAVSLGLGVMDVNIPESITITQKVASEKLAPDLVAAYAGQAVSYTDSANDLARKEAEKLMVYIWENYVEPFDFDGIVVIGAGNAFHAVAKLIGSNDSIYPNLSCVISFIHSHPVRPITNPNNPWLGQWYATHSLVHVSHDHDLWKRDKISRRYGKTVRSPEDVSRSGLNEMMKHHRDSVFDYVCTILGLERGIVDSNSPGEDEGHETEDERMADKDILSSGVMNTGEGQGTFDNSSFNIDHGNSSSNGYDTGLAASNIGIGMGITDGNVKNSTGMNNGSNNNNNNNAEYTRPTQIDEDIQMM